MSLADHLAQMTLSGLGSRYTVKGIGHYAAVLNDSTCITTDGIGTKSDLAMSLDKLDTIGIDLVAMNVNDLVCVGAKPKALVDYLVLPRYAHTTGAQIRYGHEWVQEQIAIGLMKGAEEAEIDIPGGETAFMNHFDLAGTAVGTLLRKYNPLTPSKGDLIIGLPSSGIHSNGMTHARKHLGDDPALLTPTVIYSPAIVDLIMADALITGLAHITGGGWSNLKRMGVDFKITDPLPVPAVFEKMPPNDDLNMGMGFAVMCPFSEAHHIVPELQERHPGSKVVGEAI